MRADADCAALLDANVDSNIDRRGQAADGVPGLQACTPREVRTPHPEVRAKLTAPFTVSKA